MRPRSVALKFPLALERSKLQKIFYFSCNFSIFHDKGVTLLVICRNVMSKLNSRFKQIFSHKHCGFKIFFLLCKKQKNMQPNSRITVHTIKPPEFIGFQCKASRPLWYKLSCCDSLLPRLRSRFIFSKSLRSYIL